MKRVVNVNKWHRVTVTVERNEGALDIRINSDFDRHPQVSAYLTPEKAIELSEVLVLAAKHAKGEK